MAKEEQKINGIPTRKQEEKDRILSTYKKVYTDGQTCVFTEKTLH